MFLTIIGPVGHREEVALDFPLRLGAVFDDERVFINGQEREDWRDYIPVRGDRVEIWQGAAEPISITGAITVSIATYTGISAGTVSAILASRLCLLTSMSLSGIARALTPKPKKPQMDSNREEAFGIAGFRNTTGRGTPAFVPYGQNRIWGHVISSGATLSPDGKQMMGRILYFMGDTGGDGIQSIGDILIDGTSLSNYEEIGTH